jgi:phytoene dehydrogenase-like protein
MSADDYLSRWFEHSVTRAVLGYYCSIGTFAGPRTPGSAYVVLHHIMGEHEGAGGWGFIRGGMGAISDAIAESGRHHGLQIRTDAEVVKVEAADGRVTKVVTARGDEYEARAVVCNASCKVLFDRLLDPSQLPAEFLKHVRNFRTFSTAFKINVAAEAPPRFAAFDAAACGFESPNYVHIGPDIEYLQAAYEDACHGRYSRTPLHHGRGADDRGHHAGSGRQTCRELVRWPCALHVARCDVGDRARAVSEECLRHD